MADRIEVLEREASRIDHRVAAGTRWTLPMLGHPSRTDRALARLLSSLSARAGTSGGGSDGGVPTIFDRIHFPAIRATYGSDAT